MIKLAVFGKSNFLGWTEGFETKMLSGNNPDRSLFGKARYHILEDRKIKNLAKWADVPYCEFLSEIAIKASQLSPHVLHRCGTSERSMQDYQLDSSGSVTKYFAPISYSLYYLTPEIS